jgi:hypothetical protein
MLEYCFQINFFLNSDQISVYACETTKVFCIKKLFLALNLLLGNILCCFFPTFW